MNLSYIVDFFYGQVASVYYMDIFIYGYSYLYQLFCFVYCSMLTLTVFILLFMFCFMYWSMLSLTVFNFQYLYCYMYCSMLSMDISVLSIYSVLCIGASCTGIFGLLDFFGLVYSSMVCQLFSDYWNFSYLWIIPVCVQFACY